MSQSRAPKAGALGALGRALRAYGFVVVPIVGLVELGLLAYQRQDVVSEDEWARAKAAVAAKVTARDLVIVVPEWQEPVARKYLGAELLTLPRLGRSDVAVFDRAFEVSFHGARSPELKGWSDAGEERFGRLTVRVRRNPSPVTPSDSVLEHIGKPDTVFEARGRSCPFVHAAPISGNLGFGAAFPADRYDCGDGNVAAAAILPDLDYRPRYCVLMPPPGGATPARLRLPGFHFGRTIHGYHGLYAEAERNGTGAPVTLTFRRGDEALAHFTHKDGEGWSRFEAPTNALEGQVGELVVEVTSAQGRRHYCFVADAR